MTARQQSTVHTFVSGTDAGLPVLSGVIPKGETLPQGRIIIFVNGAESAVDVYRTVFHGFTSYRHLPEQLALFFFWTAVVQ